MIKGTPIRFRIDRHAADVCMNRVGCILRHEQLGPLRCEEVQIDPQGNVSLVVFVGTSSSGRVRRNNTSVHYERMKIHRPKN